MEEPSGDASGEMRFVGYHSRHQAAISLVHRDRFPHARELEDLRSPCQHPYVAVIERVSQPGSRPYLVAWGRLTDEDEERLLIRLDAPPFVEVTIDLRGVDEVTDEGCEVLLSVAEHIGERGQRMVVLYLPDNEATKSLERTGLVDDDRIVFIPSDE